MKFQQQIVKIQEKLQALREEKSNDSQAGPSTGVDFIKTEKTEEIIVKSEFCKFEPNDSEDTEDSYHDENVLKLEPEEPSAVQSFQCLHCPAILTENWILKRKLCALETQMDFDPGSPGEMNENVPNAPTAKKRKSSNYKKHDKIACNLCGKMITGGYCYKRHLARHTRGLGAPRNATLRMCDLCDYKTHLKEKLVEHMRAHHSQPDYALENLWKMNEKGTKAPKLKVKVKEEKYACEICGKMITGGRGYKEHLARHEKGLRPPRNPNIRTELVQCEFCSKMLTRHNMKTHVSARSSCARFFF